MTPFQDGYREVFRTFGYPLGARDAAAPGVLEEAEARLGVRAPAALRDYYLVAGRERRFNTACHRLRPPSEWAVDKQKLVFMDENQSACSWGVPVRGRGSDDPPVSEGVGVGDEDEPTAWSSLRLKCSAFLAAVLHHQAVSGGLPHRFDRFIHESDAASVGFRPQDWRCYGQLKGETAYSRPNRVLCYSHESFLPMRQGWVVFAGAKTRRDLFAIAAELGVSLG